jgi:uncharacterized membrane protein YkvA (DUF1232 family)
MDTTYHRYSKDFSDEGFWATVGKYAKKIGGESIHKAVCLWVVIKESNAPMWAKSTAMAALGYLISPIDAIPDLLPGGFIDDIGVVTAAFAILVSYITDEIQLKAWQMMPEWLQQT